MPIVSMFIVSLKDSGIALHWCTEVSAFRAWLHSHNVTDVSDEITTADFYHYHKMK